MEWKLKIKLGDIWHATKDKIEDDPEAFKECVLSLIKRLKAYSDQIKDDLGEDAYYEYEEMVENLEYAEDVEEFDQMWNEVYDWADSHRVWIDTFK